MSNKFSDFPSGFDQGVLIKQLPLLQSFGGNLYWIDSGAGGGERGTFNHPVLSINNAMDLVTASNGDILVMKQGHAETITAATSAVMDVAGVALVGLGNGSLTPTLTYTTAAAATLSITAANCLVNNVRLVSDLENTAITKGITLGASADGCILSNIHSRESADTDVFTTVISVTADCDDIIIENCRHYGAAGAAQEWLELLGGSDRSIIRGNLVYGDFSVDVLTATAALSSYLTIQDNNFANIDTSAGKGVECHASTTGWLQRNRFYGAKNGVDGFTADGMYIDDNQYTNAANADVIAAFSDDS